MELTIVLRLVHVVTGVFWAGSILFIVLFFEPAMRGAGPAGAPVMQQMQRLKVFNIMPVVALFTLASGFWIYFRAAGSYGRDWLRSPAAMTYGTGGIIALLAFLVGVAVLRPTQLQAFEVAAEAQQAPPERRDALMVRIAELRTKARHTGRVIAVLLVLATVAMAVARYV